MRNKVFGRKLGRNRKSREALFKELIKSLVKNGSMTTTLAKAKSIQGQVDKLITLSKKSTLASHKLLVSRLSNDRELAEILLKKFAKNQRNSGYTRIIKLPRRLGDNAQVVKIEFVDKIDKNENVPTKSKSS